MAGSRTRSKQKQQQQQAKEPEKRKRQDHVKQAEASPTACVSQLSANLPDLGELVPGQCGAAGFGYCACGWDDSHLALIPSLPSHLPLLCLPAVDSFFDNYVNALNRQGASRPTPSGPGDTLTLLSSGRDGKTTPLSAAMPPCCCQQVNGLCNRRAFHRHLVCCCASGTCHATCIGRLISSLSTGH